MKKGIGMEARLWRKSIESSNISFVMD